MNRSPDKGSGSRGSDLCALGVLDSLRLGTLQPVVFGPGTPEQLSLGSWPDGTPYKPARLEDPCR